MPRINFNFVKIFDMFDAVTTKEPIAEALTHSKKELLFLARIKTQLLAQKNNMQLTIMLK
jgi:hypothetical protein